MLLLLCGRWEVQEQRGGGGGGGEGGGVAGRRERKEIARESRRRGRGMEKKKVWTNVADKTLARGQTTQDDVQQESVLTPVFNSRKPCRSRFLFCARVRPSCRT